MKEKEAKAPLVSVIIPAYNAEAFLTEAIQSVLAQTITDWELFIVDDCSTDGTAAISQRFSKQDPRIISIRNESNLGAAGTRNVGLERAAGKWVAFLDSDDLWHPDKLGKQLWEANETGADLIYSSYCMFREETHQRTNYMVPVAVDYEHLLRENVIGCSTVLLRREALGSRRFRTNTYHEDYALWLELLRDGVRARGCREVLVDWRIREQARSFNKWSAAQHRWEIYRRVEKLPLYKAASSFAVYAAHGIVKHKRIK